MASRGLKRSLSESTAVCRLTDESIGGVISKGLRECWNEELFFDIDLVTMEQRVIKCHKVILACVSPFFKAAFSPIHQCTGAAMKDRIELPNIPYNVLEIICKFIYTGSVEVPVKDLQDLIVTANFLQLHSIEHKCAEYLLDYIDETNCLEMSRFAKQIGVVPLIDSCVSFMESNVEKLICSDVLYDFTADEIAHILSSLNFVVKDLHGCVPPLSIQEKIIFTAVLKFSIKGSKYEVFDRLVRHVSFQNLRKFERIGLAEIASNLADKKLADMCNNALRGTGEYSDAVNVSHRVSPRTASCPFKSYKLAHGYETNIRKKFGDNMYPTFYVRGMKLWIRRWDGRPVLGGVEVLYNNECKKFHGQKFDYEVYEFVLDEDEYIVKVIAHSGYMIDSLAFITNTGKSYGPYGGDGGGRSVHNHPRGFGYLTHISGSEAFAQGSLGIVSLSFHFMFWCKPGEEGSTRRRSSTSSSYSEGDSEEDLNDSHDEGFDPFVFDTLDE